MKMTKRLRAWLVKNTDVEEDADLDEFKAAAATAMVEGDLSPEEVVELSKSTDDDQANGFMSLLKDLTSSVNAMREESADSVKGGAGEDETLEDEDDDDGTDDDAGTKGAKDDQKMSKAMSGFTKTLSRMNPGYTSDDEEGRSLDVRVKSAIEQYDSTKSTLTYPKSTESGKPHAFAGQPVKDAVTGRILESASQKDLAIAGVFAKYQILSSKTGSKNLAFSQLNDHERDLLVHTLTEEKWGGASDGGDYDDIRDRKLTHLEQKSLIDDATSGGIEAAPIVFDDQVIQAPLLNGELYPHVNKVAIPRGRRVEGVATGTVTGSWGGVDGSPISLFNTASYVSAFDTTIFRWEGSVRIGLDFLSDTPIDFGQHITAQYGERLLEDLDDVIATGNGSTQPEGCVNKTGTTSIAFGGATTIGSYESLRFGVSKAEHKASVKSSACFIGTETSYMRARAIPVGAADARRLGGMGYDSYTWMERPYKINESLTNAQIMYVLLAKYRMYRRRGLTMRTSTEGDSLIRANEMLLVATARFGGQLERGAVAAKTTTGEA